MKIADIIRNFLFPSEQETAEEKTDFPKGKTSGYTTQYTQIITTQYTYISRPGCCEETIDEPNQFRVSDSFLYLNNL